MRYRLIPLLAAVAVTACTDLVGTTEGLTIDELDRLSEALVVSTFDETSDSSTTETAATAAAAPDEATATTDFAFRRSCPLGGVVAVEGTRTRVWDRETRSGTMDLTATRTHEECARPLRRADAETQVTITLNGAPNIAIAAHHEWLEGQRHGIQEMTMMGAVDWATDDDRSGTCDVDITAAFDPEAHTRTITGTICGREIDRVTEWHN